MDFARTSGHVITESGSVSPDVEEEAADVEVLVTVNAVEDCVEAEIVVALDVSLGGRMLEPSGGGEVDGAKSGRARNLPWRREDGISSSGNGVLARWPLACVDATKVRSPMVSELDDVIGASPRQLTRADGRGTCPGDTRGG